MEYIFVVVGIVLILLGANWLVDGGSAIAKRFGISDMVIGLTIVAMGTSAPELSVNVFSAISGSTDIALGNVVGSNIGNIFLILGITALISPIPINKNTKWIEIPFNLFAVLILLLLANDAIVNDGDASSSLSRIDGVVMLLFMGLFLAYTYKTAKRGIGGAIADEIKVMPTWKSVSFVVLGFTGLIIGGKILVTGAVDIASAWGMSEKVIGLTIVAIGTSLPELATSIVAAIKGKTDIAVGNVIGSNIFNILLILGITSFIKEIPLVGTINYDLLIMLLASFLLFITAFTFRRNKVDRWEGIIFLLIYAGYLTFTITAVK